MELPASFTRASPSRRRRGAILIGVSAQDRDLIETEAGGAFDLCISKPLDLDGLERELTEMRR